jgi:hypothetical protein
VFDLRHIGECAVPVYHTIAAGLMIGIAVYKVNLRLRQTDPRLSGHPQKKNRAAHPYEKFVHLSSLSDTSRQESL